MAVCSKCFRPVLWCRTTSGRTLPLDPLPSERGTYVIRDLGTNRLARLASQEELALRDDEPAANSREDIGFAARAPASAPVASVALHRPHFETCEHAQRAPAPVPHQEPSARGPGSRAQDRGPGGEGARR